MKRFSNNESVKTFFTKERMHKSELSYARQEGATNKQIEIAQTMLDAGEAIKKVSSYTGLSNEELLAIQGGGTKTIM